MHLPEKLKHVCVYSNSRLHSDLRDNVRWLWDGVLAIGGITLLTAPEKTGKSTLLSLLLDRRRQGGQLLGRKVEEGGTLLCSEENQTIWSERQPPLDFGPELLFAQPVPRRASRRRIWRDFVRDLCEFEEGYYDLLVIDSTFNFLPAAPNNPKAVRCALQELRDFTDMPAAVLLIHQTTIAHDRRKSHGPLAAFADILIDLHIPPGDPLTRRRTFTAVGRYPGILPATTAQLSDDGTDYIVLPESAAAAYATPPALGTGLLTSPSSNIDTLVQVLANAPQPLTRLEILTHWPADKTPPHRDSITRMLDRACDLHRIVRTGPGTKSEPYRYATLQRA